MLVSWFSAGLSSFLATYIVRGEVERVLFIDIPDHHPDTYRFVEDAERMIGKPIEVLRSSEWAGVDDVIERKRYINAPWGAPCTLLLKKRVREAWEREQGVPLEYVWGYDAGEHRRADRLAQTMCEYRHRFPLIEQGIGKRDVHAICGKLGIKRPAMYDMGYPNNNCIGCVKGGMGYWNAIRRDFPEVFERRARQEREIGHSCIKGVFLDELEPGRGRMEPIPECLGLCGEAGV